LSAAGLDAIDEALATVDIEVTPLSTALDAQIDR